MTNTMRTPHMHSLEWKACDIGAILTSLALSCKMLDSFFTETAVNEALLGFQTSH